jgi:hypothetical protein
LGEDLRELEWPVEEAVLGREVGCLGGTRALVAALAGETIPHVNRRRDAFLVVFR